MSSDHRVVQQEDQLNFDNFVDHLNYEISRAKRFKRSVSMCVFSFDGSENFFGDRHELLRQLSQLVRATLRTVDLLVASSSEELAIILPETDLKGAVIAAERIVSEVAKKPFVSGGNALNLTLSGSVATYPDHGNSADDLAQRAIDKVKAISDAGGNRVGTL